MSIDPSPKRLGRYEILDQIGRGAMGVVYLAKDPLIGRLVALKTLRLVRTPEDDEIEQFRRRFIREAQSAGILSHPNIVTIHDVVDEEEATFIAMEYVRGTDLKALIRGHDTLELDFVVDVVDQVARALDYAHGKGVIHRDVKPGNVLLTGDGQVKITDFGIARLHTSSLTLDHELLGTPNYMAPEQILGTEVDRRADLFSLGVVLYEMLTGQKPFQGENLTAVTHKIVYEDFTSPSEYVSRLPPGIEDVLSKALAKKPEDRYATGRELADDLARCVREYREESSHSATHRMRRPERRSPSRAFGEASDGLSAILADWKGQLSERPPARRALATAALTTLLALLVGGWLLSRLEAHGPSELSTIEQERDREYLELVREGRRLLEEGAPTEARDVLQEAERRMPEKAPARTLLARAHREAESLTEAERQVSRHLSEAREAIKAGRFARAVRATEAALALDPDDERATELHAVALDLERMESRRAAASQPRVSSSEPVPPVDPTPDVTPSDATPSFPASAEERAAADQALPTLETFFVSYHQDQPVGTLTVLLGADQLFKHEFRFLEKRGFLGLGREAYDGQLQVRPVDLPPGRHVLRIYVTPRGEPALAEIVEGRFEPGDARRLSIFWSEAGELTARLE